MKDYHIFIIEDDPWYGEILEYHLTLNPDYRVTRFGSAKECLDNLHLKPNLITVDYSLPDMTGEQLFSRIKNQNPALPVIIISGQEKVVTAVSLLKMGVAEYLVKDDHTRDLLWNAILRIRECQDLKEEVEILRDELGQKYALDKIIQGNSNAIRKIFTLLEKAAKTNINVSITGETGTGKELAAKAIHYNSDRNKMPFIALNMSAIPFDLLESELFGYEKGAFTGALTRKTGKFEEANKGTLFLDEIGEMDMSIQSKLLRVLQERELYRLGGNEPIKLDVRIIVATHKNLAKQVELGKFREDLYYRIIGMPVELPPLRVRDNDILLLAKYFLDEFCKENKMPLKILDNDAKNKLMNYTYPGNIRELKAIIDLAVVMSEGTQITSTDIVFANAKTEDNLLASETTMKEYTARIIQYFLEKNDNNVVKVAEKLDIGKSTIYNMIKSREIRLK
ncbi:MAG: sigma-54 dependent transcriptional regulator [Daejeonella sp.]|uniref:sigma-54-dependent transcriptional regulator n=1 Tax=Daejeonella sp. TaxID=2805397 RepID=UPI0027339648|nr:sigma-54 dependent transcriptional regulator [Daejeonella sp.]MDP3469453.1 sigma-54 dependent transcriptional regulator [Daejeonella sp.]